VRGRRLQRIRAQEPRVKADLLEGTIACEACRNSLTGRMVDGGRKLWRGRGAAKRKASPMEEEALSGHNLGEKWRQIHLDPTGERK